MIIRVTTENDSIYEINTEQNTWARLITSPLSGYVRTDSGPYYTVDLPEINKGPMVITGPPLEQGDLRVITTSWVVAIDYEKVS
jgi:hypothetical protein